MSDDRIRDLLVYRIDQAHESIREAEILLRSDAFRGAINRAYYAMFYAVLALLATRQLGTSKHSGAIALFDREFVKPGLFPRGLSRSLHVAFDLRQTHDYGEITPPDLETAEVIVAEARDFVNSVAAYLSNSGLL